MKSILQEVLPAVLVDVVLSYHVPTFHKSEACATRTFSKHLLTDAVKRPRRDTILLWDGLAASRLGRDGLFLFDFQPQARVGGRSAKIGQEFRHTCLDGALDIKAIRDSKSRWFRKLLVLTKERHLLALGLDDGKKGDIWCELQGTTLDRLEYLHNDHIVLGSSGLAYGSYLYKMDLSVLPAENLQAWQETSNWRVGDLVFMPESNLLIVLETTFHQLFCLDSDGHVIADLKWLAWFPRGIFPTCENHVEVNDSDRFYIVSYY